MGNNICCEEGPNDKVLLLDTNATSEGPTNASSYKAAGVEVKFDGPVVKNSKGRLPAPFFQERSDSESTRGPETEASPREHKTFEVDFSACGEKLGKVCLKKPVGVTERRASSSSTDVSSRPQRSIVEEHSIIEAALRAAAAEEKVKEAEAAREAAVQIAVAVASQASKATADATSKAYQDAARDVEAARAALAEAQAQKADLKRRLQEIDAARIAAEEKALTAEEKVAAAEEKAAAAEEKARAAEEKVQAAEEAKEFAVQEALKSAANGHAGHHPPNAESERRGSFHSAGHGSESEHEFHSDPHEFLDTEETARSV